MSKFLGRGTIGIGLALCLSSATSGQEILFVDDDAPPGGDGLIWNSAFIHLQDALTAARAPGSEVLEIRVAQGVYRPDQDTLNPGGSGARDASFYLVDGVAIIGGFAGFGQPEPDQRDLDLYVSMLSGDLLGDDEPEFVNRTDNSYHIIVAENVGSTTRLEGLSVVGGNADGEAPFDGGGGMLMNLSELLVRDCQFADNFAIGWGGGVAATLSEPVYEHCIFSGNQTQSEDGYDGGGGHYSRNSTPTLTDCYFTGNVSSRGGALHHRDIGSVSLTRCTFSQNRSPEGTGGGIYIASGKQLKLLDCVFSRNAAKFFGGAIFFRGGSLEARRCLFADNYVLNRGGAVFIGLLYDSSAIFDTCAFFSNWAKYGGACDGHIGFVLEMIFANSLFAGNKAYLRGGAAYSTYGRLRFVNSTFTANQAPEGGISFTQRLNTSSTGMRFQNCVLWDNGQNPVVDNGGTSSLEYCLIEGGWTGLGGNNIDADPDFVDADGPDDDPLTFDDNDYRLQPTSPGVDVGSNALITEGITLDFDGAQRVLDGDSDGLALVDLGAFELMPDCNENGIADEFDLSEGASTDCNSNHIPDECEVPFCNNLIATVYVDPCGFIVGGLLDGQPYRGVLLGTFGRDVIVGTERSEIIISFRGDDVICGNGGFDRILNPYGHKPASRRHSPPTNADRR